VHPLCVRLRELRRAAGMSLRDVEHRYHISAMVIGSYERGDRLPPLPKLDTLLQIYGHRLTTEPINSAAVRTPGDMVSDLRAITEQLEKAYDVPLVSEPAPQQRLPLPHELPLPASREDHFRV
jgi:transcriptional regulator with XRE-family HTH domain